MTLTHSESIKEIAAALARAQGAIGGAVKASVNPYFKSSYADLASVCAAIQAPFAAEGLAIVQCPSTDGVRVSVDTMLIHASGEWMRGTLAVSAKEDSPQAVGSCITYLRRYALQAFARVAPEDDDAEAAEGRALKTEPVPQGYADWKTDMTASVEGGATWKQFSEAYKQSAQAFRDYAAKYDRAWGATLKTKAQANSAAEVTHAS